MQTGPNIDILTRIDMVRLVPGPDRTVHRREVTALLPMLGLGVEMVGELMDRLVTDASAPTPPGAPEEAGPLLAVLDGFVVSGRQTLMVLRADTRMSRSELTHLKAALDALSGMSWDLLLQGEEDAGEGAAPLRPILPGEAVVGWGLIGLSRRGASALAAWMRGRAGEVLLAGDELNDMASLLLAFRSAHRNLGTYVSTRPLAHRQPAGIPRSLRADPRTPLMTTFLALAGRPRRRPRH